MNIREIWKPGVLSLLMVFSIVVIVDFMEKATAYSTYTVNSAGGANYLTIGGALNVARDGDTIIVYIGNGYSENLAVNYDLTIDGVINGITRPLVTPASQNTPVFTINSAGVTIKDLHIDGTSTSGVDGIYSTAIPSEENGVLIDNCEIDRCFNGILLGIPPIYPTWHTVRDCIIQNNDNDGIKIDCQDGYHLIDGCDIYDNNMYGIEITGDHNSITECDIYLNTDGIHIVGDTNSIFGDDEGSYCIVHNNGNDGISLNGDYNSIADDVSVHNNTDDGIYVCGASDTLIEECIVVYNGDDGIFLEDCDDTDIQWCYLSQNVDCGIMLDNSDETYTINTDFSTGDIGIYFLQCGRSGIDVDCCDFYDLDIAIKVEGSNTLGIYGNPNQGEWSNLYGCTYGLYAICDSSGNPSDGYIQKYNIQNGTTIYLRGYDVSLTTDFTTSNSLRWPIGNLMTDILFGSFT